MGVFGLLDHVMFVYGYDKENLYVFDTLKAKIAYYNYDSRYKHIYRLPKSIIKSRWSIFARVWEVV
jgi:uncharacterized protein YvpB